RRRQANESQPFNQLRQKPAPGNPAACISPLSFHPPSFASPKRRAAPVVRRPCPPLVALLASLGQRSCPSGLLHCAPGCGTADACTRSRCARPHLVLRSLFGKRRKAFVSRRGQKTNAPALAEKTSLGGGGT